MTRLKAGRPSVAVLSDSEKGALLIIALVTTPVALCAGVIAFLA